MTAFDFLLDTYETERLKTLSVWSSFTDADLEFRPAERIRTPHEHMVHQCVSEDAWMKNMLGIDTGEAALPQKEERREFIQHYAVLSATRLARLREKPEEWWRETAKFFDADRSRTWIMLRRLTHSAHHRAQLVVYLRLLGHPVYSTYGPTGDTGGLPANKAPTIYRRFEEESGPDLHGPIGNPTERPGGFIVRSLQRTPVRVRETGATVSAWQLIVDSERGPGSITLIDASGQPHYRGEGAYFGWSQERLAAEYQRLNKPPDEPTFELAQLG
jgi:uncharacterized damage-inducible protein DinB